MSEKLEQCPDCGSELELVDSADTPGPITWECPKCGRAVHGRVRTEVGHVIEDGDDIDVYAARGSGRKAMGEVAVGQRGWLGNPYTVAEHGREGAIEKFREDFEERLESDEEFRQAVADLAGSRLGCFCQTLDEHGPACHAEVIAEHADRISRFEAARTA